MISAYIKNAMTKAHYEILPNDKVYYGEIEVCQGVYATGRTLEECRRELRSVLEGWILLSLQKQITLPIIDGLDLPIQAIK